jgi:hypothetical protein
MPTVPKLAVLLAIALAPQAVHADDLADGYRRANDQQRLQYIERVIGSTRYRTQTPVRLAALAAVAKRCVDDWDPKLEPKFVDQVASCVVMANRQVKAEP